MPKDKRVRKQPLREIAILVCDYVTKLDDKKLRKLSNHCKLASQTNCWWLIYHLKDVVLELVKSEQKWRKSQAKEK